MTQTPAPGTTRFLVKSRLGVGRDFAVLDPDTKEQRYVVDGKWALAPKAEVQDASGAVVYRGEGRMLGIPKKLAILDASGTQVAELHAKAFSPIKSRMTISFTGGEEWSLVGSLMEKEYDVTAAGTTVMHITQKWLNVRDTFTMDVTDGVDPALAAMVMWAVAAFAEAK